MSMDAMIRANKLLICVGSGGVGKTTVAASIGLRAARLGKKSLVLTIDPARRLANSLGLSRFGNEETQIELEDAPGELWAMMLDAKSTFDALIHKVSPDSETAEKILANRVYRHVADSFGGSQEYMATERLYDVMVSGQYDLVVLDTPPVKNALDFLESPGRMSRFLDRRIMQWFLSPYDDGRVFGRFMRGTSALVFRLLGYIFGREFLDELAEFLYLFRNLYDGFRERHEAVIRMFSDGRTQFVVVMAPTGPSSAVAHYFIDALDERKMPRSGVVINQLHQSAGKQLDPDELLGPLAMEFSKDLAPHTDSQLLARLGAAHRRLLGLAKVENGFINGIRERQGPNEHLWTVPRFEGEVHDISALDRVGKQLA